MMQKQTRMEYFDGGEGGLAMTEWSLRRKRKRRTFKTEISPLHNSFSVLQQCRLTEKEETTQQQSGTASSRTQSIQTSMHVS